LLRVFWLRLSSRFIASWYCFPFEFIMMLHSHFAGMILTLSLMDQAVSRRARFSALQNKSEGLVSKMDENSGKWPMSVKAVWDNHFSAFGEFDISKIMKDYNDASLVSIFNDVCNADGARPGTGYRVFKGRHQIQRMFVGLFNQLRRDASHIARVGPKHGQPVVIEAPGGNVFLTWATTNLPPNDAIDYATDTFSFRKHYSGRYTIHKQNIVVTQQGPCPFTPQQWPSNPPRTPLEKAWDNHFQAFGQQDVRRIMKDYTQKSILQVYDWGSNKYTSYRGLSAISSFFSTTFRDLGKDPGVTVPLLQLDQRELSVFLVWKSKNIPHATDTFIFDTDGRTATISRQNIVLRPNSRFDQAKSSLAEWDRYHRRRRGTFCWRRPKVCNGM